MPACRRRNGRRTGAGFDPDARVIVKPVWEHGSLGIGPDSVVRGADAPRAIAERTLRWNTEHFAERYIDGREFASAMMEGPDGVELLPIRETVFQGFDDGEPLITDYDAKWTPGSQPYAGTPRRFGLEREEPELAAELNRLALACWDLFRCRRLCACRFPRRPRGRALHPRGEYESLPQLRCGLCRFGAGSRARL